MMKSTVYFFLVCVLEGLAWAAGSSGGDCLIVKDVCYQVFVLPRNFYDSNRFCRESEGRIAGKKYDFVEIMNTDPAMKNFLQKSDCYWVEWEDYVGENLAKLSYSTNAISLFGALAFAQFSGQKLCYENGQWESFLSFYRFENNFVCEYDLPIIQVLPAKKTMKFGKVQDSTVIVKCPLFKREASLQILCARLCLQFNGCSVFNYNTVSKECRGFERKDRVSTRHHPEWEVWTIGWWI